MTIIWRAAHRVLIALLVLFILLPSSFCLSAQAAPFVITVIDDQTNRAVPLVELTTVNHIAFVTDSAGNVAFDEPGLMGQRVYFDVKSHGYEYPKDGFGFRGVALDVKAGGAATIKVKRLNIAQRLYRITGQGIYRDTILAGGKAPIAGPLLNAQVTGQDSAHAVIYKDAIHWFWGDTNRVAYPLGHFGTAGATSRLPGAGGLDPGAGIDLTYLVDDKGFSRPTLPGDGPNPRWIEGVVAFTDAGGEHLIARCDTMRSLGERLTREAVMWDDATQRFQTLAKLDRDEVLCPSGHPFLLAVEGVDYLYFGEPYPCVRVRADLNSVKAAGEYQVFTCLTPGARFDLADPKLDRDAAGKLTWAWKKNAWPISQEQQGQLLKTNSIKPDEAWYRARDVETNEVVRLHGGNVAWNVFRKRWVMIAVQVGGKPSHLGEVWYAEADRPEGPYAQAKKIVTHDRYSFYNPVHHPFFDQDGGRTIYFEGTYTTTFSGNDRPTPRYDYNQVMYKLDLADERLTAAQVAGPQAR